MSKDYQEDSPWAGDLLSYVDYGKTFTNLVQSIDDAKVISIEAGYGYGKTFFRTAWAEHLRKNGEIVVEIDALQSDHSGEPIITFLGALLAAVPKKQKDVIERLGKNGKKLAGAVSRTVLRAVLRSGADEVIDTATEWLSQKADGYDALEGAVDEVEQEMSKLAGQMIASQLAAENARQKELPEQILALRDALTAASASRRVIILIDELDRCHPEYAIALLEAMKLVFGLPGFVFCLMVNVEYLERVAARRFGEVAEGERYLDKFVDIRLKLEPTKNSVRLATQTLAKSLPLNIPFGSDRVFSVDAAAELAGKIAQDSGLSIRQIKRVLVRVELALRCYRDRPLDLPLLILLAFSEAAPGSRTRLSDKKLLPRADLTPERAAGLLKSDSPGGAIDLDRRVAYECQKFVNENCRELIGLDEDRYGLDRPQNGGTYYDWYKVLGGLGPRYVPEHNEVLNAVHLLMAE